MPTVSDKRPNFARFDVASWLVKKGIPYATEGENISKKGNWIGVNCPFCVVPDTKNHLGINLNTKAIKCWRCSVKGTIIKYMMKIQHISYEDALMQVGTKRSALEVPDEYHREVPDKTITPLPIHEGLLDPHRQYLVDRHFDPDKLIHDYKLRCTGPVTDMPYMANRIVIPYIINNRIVTYTTRDITDKAQQRYRAAEVEHSIIPIDHLLYNIHTVKDTAIIVEGSFDVFRIGPGTVGMGSLVWNSQRVIQLRHVKRAFIFPDFEYHAKQEWEILAHSIATIVPDVHFCDIDEGDPGALTDDDVRNFRLEIFGKIY